ncbi:MAG: Rieske (2Fe-2S) protein [Candidatus Methylacidiphilales bacterium]|nr:Rieske 2Fe-2S domain-containing protein [Candidatus Methylacidiphilales bacterium]
MTKIKVCTLNELPTGTGRRVVVEPGWEIGVFRTAGGGIHAIDNRCPHAGAPLHNGHIAGEDIVCPLHMWSFSLITGRCTSFRGPEVETFPTEVVDDTIFLLLDTEEPEAGS